MKYWTESWNIMRFLARIKAHFSTVSTHAWHYQVTTALWKPRRVDGRKACSYYWFKLPLALVVMPIVVLLAIPLGGIIFGISCFSGYIPTFMGSQEQAEQYEDRGSYPYKTLPSGKRVGVVPWEVAAVLGGIYGIYYISFVNRDIGMVVGIVLVGLAILGGLLYAVSSKLKLPPVQQQRAKIKAAWDKVCPPLTVVD